MGQVPSMNLDDFDTFLLSGTGVFLDTSVHVARFFETEDRRRKVETVATGRPVFTSSTVFREFQWAILSAFQFISDVLRDVPNGAKLRMTEISRHVMQAPGIYGERRAKRISLVLDYLEDLLSDRENHYPRDIADLSLGEMERFRRRRFFRVGLPGSVQDIRTDDRYVDVVSCAVAKQPRDPVKPAAMMMSCDSKTRLCEVRPLLGVARLCLVTLPAQWRTRRPRNAVVVDKVLGWSAEQFAGRRAVGQQSCWPLADVIIAHECPPDVVLVTSDRDFLFIAPKNGHRRVLLVR